MWNDFLIINLVPSAHPEVRTYWSVWEQREEGDIWTFEKSSEVEQEKIS
jgi:hypothetical protein